MEILKRNCAFFYRHQTLFFVLISFFVLLSFAALHYPNFQGPLFRDRWFVCMDYIKLGTLYQGQPYCEQGPILYYILYFFYSILGTALYSGLTLFAVSIHTTLLSLLRTFIFRETRVRPFFSLLFVYVFFLYYPYLSNLDIVLASFFFFVSVYILFYTHYKHRLILSVIFVFLAIFTKYILLLPAVFLFVYYLFTQREQITERIETIFLIFTPLLALLYFFFPNFFYYVSIIHTTYPKGTFFSAVSTFLSGFSFFTHHNIYFFFLVLIISFGFFSFMYSKSLFSFLLSFPFFFLIIIFLRQTNRDVLSLVTYFFPFYFLFVLCLFCFYFSLSQKYRLALFFSFLLFLIPFLLFFYQDQLSVASSRIILRAGSDFLSNVNGIFLIERKPNDLSLLHEFPYFSLDNKEFYALNPVFLEWDTTTSPRLIFSLGFNASTTFYKRSISESELAFVTHDFTNPLLLDSYFLHHYLPLSNDVLFFSNLINAKKYDVALVLFSQFDASDNSFPYSNLYDLFNYSQMAGVSHCSVAVPFLQNSDKPVLYVYFSDFATCTAFKEEISRYYAGYYDNLCLLSFDHAETVRKVLEQNAQFLPSCQDISSFTFNFFGNTSFHP